MIERLIGTIAERADDSLVVLVGGVGLRVWVPRRALDHTTENETVQLLTHLVVREDALTLYGFIEPQDRQVFEILIKINGVGPKLALTILSTLTIEHLHNAVQTEKAEVLTRVPGIGKKTAERILLDLKNQVLFKPGLDGVPLVDDTDADVMDTLLALGYSVVEAQQAIQSIPPGTSDDVEERVRVALAYFT